MKSLLLEAYVKGQQELLYVVPFVAKVLESSVRSVVSLIPSVLSEARRIVSMDFHSSFKFPVALPFLNKVKQWENAVILELMKERSINPLMIVVKSGRGIKTNFFMKRKGGKRIACSMFNLICSIHL